MQLNPLAIGVIGCGRMGQRHLTVLERMKHLSIAALVEPANDRRNNLSHQYKCPGFARVEDLQMPLDGVVIASPTSTHFSIAQHFLDQKIPCLIEKPIAPLPQEVAMLNQTEVPILVNHSERHNPAFLSLMQALAGETILTIRATRLSAGSKHIIDADVLMDLMIHDVDMTLLLANRPLIAAKGLWRQNDHGEALLEFADGLLVNLTASRLSPCNLREFMVMTPSRLYRADLLTHSLWVQEKGSPIQKPLPVSRKEPLMAQWEHFSEVIQGRALPQVNPQIAQKTLEVIWQLQAGLHPTPQVMGTQLE